MIRLAGSLIFCCRSSEVLVVRNEAYAAHGVDFTDARLRDVKNTGLDDVLREDKARFLELTDHGAGETTNFLPRQVPEKRNARQLRR